MGRLGVNYRGDESTSDYPNARLSNASNDTYMPHNRMSTQSTNMTILKDQSSPKEIARTTINFNQSKSEIESNAKDQNNNGASRGDDKSPMRRQSSNVAGYFSSQPNASSTNRFSMPVGNPQNRLTTNNDQIVSA